MEWRLRSVTQLPSAGSVLSDDLDSELDEPVSDQAILEVRRYPWRWPRPLHRGGCHTPIPEQPDHHWCALHARLLADGYH